jgi:hypothetical protein
LDRSVGGILAALDKQGIADNTLVIFSSDNGGVFVPQRTDSLQTKAFQAGLKVNGALRGGKHDVWQGGFQVPFLVRWPGKTPAGTVCSDMISLVDILATTAAIVGEPLPAAAKGAEDSHNFLPAILGESSQPAREDMIVHSSDGVFAIRKGPWKWIEGVPVDDIKPAARKAKAVQFHAQLYNTLTDPGETQDLSAEHPEIAKELSTLLNRYRDGNYSRELPPAGAEPKTAAIDLSPPAGETVLDMSLAELPSAPWKVVLGDWASRDGSLWGRQKSSDKQGATLSVPCQLTDATIQYEINFQGASRHSCRIECGKRQHSFRIEVSRLHVGLTKNPSFGENVDQTDPLARRPLKLESGTWYPVRITIRGSEATVQVNDIAIKGSHAVIGEAKTGLNLLVFGESAGFRNLKVVK